MPPMNMSDADYAMSSVPLSQRKGPVTMGLLWLTMVTAFPTVMIGFEWCKKGLTMPQLLACTTISCLMLMLYSIPAIQLGARSGLSYTALSRNVFGRWGSRLITANLIWLFTGVYGLMALYMAESLVGLFHWSVPVPVLAALMAAAMAANNFFGFKGVANFARFFAAPALIVWVLFTFFKASTTCSADILTQTSQLSFSTALTMVSSFVIGFAVWGNEMDYWRFSRPKVAASAVPLAGALVLGQIMFPAAGWMVAKISGVTEYGAATALMNNYSFGGLAVVAAVILGASYFSSNDSNLFGCVQACENLKQLNHRTWALIVALVGAGCAAMLSILGVAKSMEIFTSLNCVIMPTPTVIMMAEWLLMARVFKSGPISQVRVPTYLELPAIRSAATISLVFGIAVGLLTAGVLPGTERFTFGVSSVQAWLSAFALYIPLRLIEHKRAVESFEPSTKQLTQPTRELTSIR
jgi:purine-cytosine permease-like protein